MNVNEPGLAFYADRIRDGKPFAFARYGNGEWDCILGLYPRTRSGSQRFTPDLRAALARTLIERPDGDWWPAMQSRSYLERVRLLPRLRRWLDTKAPGLPWHGGEVFHKASKHGQLAALVRAMRGRKVVVVGPPWLKSLSFADEFIGVRSRDCWQDVDKTIKQLRGKTDCVISFSAGPAAKVMIHRLWPILDGSSWLIDMGSLWDPYCGKRTRTYHRHVTAERIKRNLA